MNRGSVCFAVLVAAILLGGCATGKNLIDYSSANPTINYSGRCSIAVAVHDLRQQVSGGGLSVTQVGETPGAATRQTPLFTSSGKPFARVTADVVARAFNQKGFEAKILDTTPSQTPEAVVEMARGIGSTHSLVVTIREWWSAVHHNAIILYDVTLSLLDENGTVIARVDSKGEQNLTDGTASTGEDEKAMVWGAPPVAPAAPIVDEDSFDEAFTSTTDAEPNPDDGQVPTEETPAVSEQPQAAPEINKTSSQLLIDFFETRLGEMLNDPSVPRVMKRFDTSKVQRPQDTETPLEAAGSFGEAK